MLGDEWQSSSWWHEWYQDHAFWASEDAICMDKTIANLDNQETIRDWTKKTVVSTFQNSHVIIHGNHYHYDSKETQSHSIWEQVMTRWVSGCDLSRAGQLFRSTRNSMNERKTVSGFVFLQEHGFAQLWRPQFMPH